MVDRVTFTVKCLPWAQAELEAKPVRYAVFVVEQRIDESEEWDEHDAVSTHAIAWLDGVVVGTGRLLPDGKIGRMAVLPMYRGLGAGAQIFDALLAEAIKQGHTEIKLSAQQSVIEFYKKWGFACVGPPHDEVGIAHQWMSLQVQSGP